MDSKRNLILLLLWNELYNHTKTKCTVNNLTNGLIILTQIRYCISGYIIVQKNELSTYYNLLFLLLNSKRGKGCTYWYYNDFFFFNKHIFSL